MKTTFFNILTAIIIISSLLILSGCNQEPNEISNKTPVEIQLNQEFNLKIGETALLQDEDLKIEFMEVVADERYLTPYERSLEGPITHAVVKIQVSQSGETKDYNLNNGYAPGAYNSANEQTFNNYVIKLIDLKPEKDTAKKIPKSEYEIVLKLTKKEPLQTEQTSDKEAQAAYQNLKNAKTANYTFYYPADFSKIVDYKPTSLFEPAEILEMYQQNDNPVLFLRLSTDNEKIDTDATVDEAFCNDLYHTDNETVYHHELFFINEENMKGCLYFEKTMLAEADITFIQKKVWDPTLDEPVVYTVFNMYGKNSTPRETKLNLHAAIDAFTLGEQPGEKILSLKEIEDSSKQWSEEITDIGGCSLEEIDITQEEAQKLIAKHDDPFLQFLRTALDNYLAGNYEGIASSAKEAGTTGEDNLPDGLDSFDKSYYESDFVVVWLDNGVFGGKMIYILFVDKPDTIFTAWVYDVSDDEYELRSFNKAKMNEEVDMEQFISEIECFMNDERLRI
jgi:hypothetical protein